MSKGKKERKKKHEMPPLSKLDRLIYGIVGALMFAVLAAYGLWLCLRPEMGHWIEEETVLACRVHASRYWAVPLFFSLTVTFGGLWDTWHGQRRPIFGIKGFVYGPPLPKIYPVFMKNKPPKKPKDRSFTRFITAVAVGVNLVMLALVPLSFNGRDEWHPDGTVRDVDMFGRTAAEYDAADAREVILGSVGHSAVRGWRRRSWLDLQVELVMADGESYTFEFRDASRLRELEAVLGSYADVSPDPDTDLDRLIDDLGPTAEQEEILHRLFQTEE